MSLRRQHKILEKNITSQKHPVLHYYFFYMLPNHHVLEPPNQPDFLLKKLTQGCGCRFFSRSNVLTNKMYTKRLLEVHSGAIQAFGKTVSRYCLIGVTYFHKTLHRRYWTGT